MERRHQARTPVNINALLIGEKTVPKGCRVINVSQNGMQLQCDADGRLLTFKDGDSVDVHLSIQYEGKQKKLTIPSWVRHVAANSVDVEFHRPDPQLVDLIEAYRTSEHHRIEASLGRADRRTAASRASGVNTGGAAGTDRLAQTAGVDQPGNRPFYPVVLATVFTVCVITGGYVYTASIDSRLTTLETMSKRQSTEISELHDKLFNASLQEGRYASLNARMTALNDAFVNLENRTTGAIPATASPAGVKPQAAERSAQQPAVAGPPVASSAVKPEAASSVTPTDDIPLPVRTSRKAATIDRAAVPGEPPATPAAHTMTESPGAAASPGAQERIAADTGPGPVASAPLTTTAALEKPGAAATSPEKQVTRTGPWVINLISSPDKADVERFSSESGAAQHGAVMNSATVKGREYWRLQITGFASAAAASKHAETVKQALGIKDVWIFKQK